MSGRLRRRRRDKRSLPPLLGIAALLLAAPLGAQERSEPAPDTIPITRSDTTRADSLRGGPKRGPTTADVVEMMILGPPPDTRAPWPWGPKDKYKTIGALTGGGAGLVLSQFNGKDPVLSALACGLLGYLAGMLFDLPAPRQGPR